MRLSLLLAALAVLSAPVLAQPGVPGDPGVSLDLTLALQGAYDSASGTLRTTLRSDGVLPSAQPYDAVTYDGTPLAYAGTEANANLPATAVDWILVEARTSTEAASRVRTVAALLLADGSVVAAEGSGLPVLSGLAAASYRIVVRHRNHLAAISAAPVDFSTGTGTLDATAPGALDGTVEVASGVRALWTADASLDGIVTAPDFNAYASAAAASTSGYALEDFSLDGLVTAADFNLYSANAAVSASSTVLE